MAAHPSDLCPLCKQRALTLNTAGTVLVCASCGAQANFDETTRRVRYTVVPQAHVQFDEALRNRWLTRVEVFDVMAASSQPRIKRLRPWAIVLALLGGVGVIGLAVTFARGLPAQPPTRVASTRPAEGPTAIQNAPTAPPTLANTLAHTPVVSATATAKLPPAQAIALPTDAPNARQAVQEVTATSAAQPATSASLVIAPSPTPTARPIAVPTVDAQRSAGVATAQPSSTPVTIVLSVTPTPLAVNALVAAQEPLPMALAATPTVPTVESTAPTQTPTEIMPTETAMPTETPLPTPTQTQTPVPAMFSISKLAYVGGSAFEEYLELTNATDQVLALPIQTWKMRISTAVGATELKLGAYLTAPISLPARQSCRIYTSKRVASVDEVSPCGFLTLGIVDDVDGIYPDNPGATVTMVNGESQAVAVFRY
jgi:hypothetical protein